MNSKERVFREIVWDYYRRHGRHDLPWRQTAQPYQIVVSELMLQQTQVTRVVPKYELFVARWPSAKHLASAPLGEVIRAWQGLGYNRRAKYLHETAKIVTHELGGTFPSTTTDLRTLPGLGPYTAAAVVAFAYNQPVSLIETNVRQVFLHHFFGQAENVADSDILRLVAKTLPTENAREWYWALMDYGSHLKERHGNLGRKSKHYTKQSMFKGSDREVRGAILRSLGKSDKANRQLYADLATFSATKIRQQLSALTAEGLIIEEKNKRHRLP